MRALILVGGKGTRLYPLTYTIPKPMVPLLNRPFLEHVIDWLKEHRIQEVALTTCYLPQVIRSHFLDGVNHGIRMQYIYEEQPLGTGGAIKSAERLMRDTTLILNGDILTDLDLSQLLEFHRQRQAKVTIALHWVEDPTPYGVVETAADGRILRFLEKPPPEQVTTNWINAGTYLFEPEIIADMPNGRFSVERDLYPALLAKGVPMYGFQYRGYWLDIGSAGKYLQAHRDLLAGRLKARMHAREVSPGVWLEPGARVESAAKLVPPVVVGRGSLVHSGATVGPHTVLGPEVVVEEHSHIKHSVIWQQSRVCHHAELDHCVVGRQCLIGPHTYLSQTSLGDGEVVESESAQ